jgi:AcrR family transcriptional regulator
MTSIEMIRDKSESSVGAIYHHFKNKEGISCTFFAALDQTRLQRDQHYV